MEHHTLSEILSQPKTWKTVIDFVSNHKPSLEASVRNSAGKELVFVGCGTSYYLALSAASAFRKITNGNCSAVPASDLLIFPEQTFRESNPDYVVVLISRSGATTEVLWTRQVIGSRYRFPAWAISCRPGSRLVRECENAFVIPEADEKSVVMTRSFTSMLLMIQLLASLQSTKTEYFKELSSLPDKGSAILETMHQTARRIAEKENVVKYVYLGQGPYYGLACESMLKIKEMSISSSEAYHTLEFRHGPMSTADGDTLITFFISERGQKEEVALLKEMKALKAKTLVICERATDEIRNSADYLIELESGIGDFTRLILCMPVTQLLGYYTARTKGLDPDRPRHLAQVVQLE